MNTTATRTEAGILADAVRAVNAEAIEFVEGCAPGAWAQRTAEEGWTLSMAAAHIAIAHLAIAQWVHRVASGQDVTETPTEWVALNASDASYNSELSRSDVVERLRVYGGALERYVRDSERRPAQGFRYVARSSLDHCRVGPRHRNWPRPGSPRAHPRRRQQLAG